MYRKSLIALLLALLTPLISAQPAPDADPERLPPPIEHVLNDLSLTSAVRAEVHSMLLRQREERRAADEALRQRHRTELATLLTPDQLVALDAARPRPPGPPPAGPHPQPPPR